MSPLIPHGQRFEAKRVNTAERVSRAIESRVGIDFRAERAGVRGAKWRLADPRPKPCPFRSAGGVSVRSRHSADTLRLHSLPPTPCRYVFIRAWGPAGGWRVCGGVSHCRASIRRHRLAPCLLPAAGLKEAFSQLAEATRVESVTVQSLWEGSRGPESNAGVASAVSNTRQQSSRTAWYLFIYYFLDGRGLCYTSLVGET